MADSFVFYRSFAECLEELDDTSYRKMMRAITQYALDGIIPELSGFEKALFIAIKPQIDANTRRRECGSMGGRPRNENAENQTKPSRNHEEQESETKNHEKPNETIVINQEPNVNDNANVNDNENVNTTYHKLIYDTWIKNDLPSSKLSKNNYLNFQQTELKQCLNEINQYSLNPQEVVHAIENAGSVKKLMDSGQSWRQFSISFKSFWNNIATYFDGAFDLNAFKKPNNSVSAELNTVDFDALKSQADVDRELNRLYHQRK